MDEHGPSALKASAAGLRRNGRPKLTSIPTPKIPIPHKMSDQAFLPPVKKSRISIDALPPHFNEPNRVCSALASFDFAKLRKELIESGTFDIEETTQDKVTAADAALKEFARFLAFKVIDRDFDGQKFPASPTLDAIWSAEILRTKEYRALCRRILPADALQSGVSLLDRFAGEEDEVEAAKNQKDNAKEDQIKLYRKSFG